MNAELIAANVAAHWIQAGLLVAASLTVLRLVAPAWPIFRLTALQMILAAIVILPAVQPRADATASVVTTDTPYFTAVVVLPESQGKASRTALSRGLAMRVALAAAGAGVAGRVGWLLLGMFRLWRFRRIAIVRPAPDAARHLEEVLEVRPRYLAQPGNHGPWTFGVIRPTVALPPMFDALDVEIQRSVICHELLHVKRRDTLTALVEEVVVAFLWFHPWAWLLRSRIRVAREQAVDARVIAILDNREEYVRCLVDMSGHDLAQHLSHGGAAILRPRELRARIDAVLKDGHMSARRAVFCGVFLSCVMAGTSLLATGIFPLRVGGDFERVLIAPGRDLELKPAFARAQSPMPASEARRQIRMTPAEYPPEALARGIRGTVTVDITINQAGDVTTAAVVSGPQELRTAAFTIAMGLKYEAAPSMTAGRIGVQFQIDRSSWGVRVVELRASGAGAAGSPPVATPAGAQDDWAGSVRVGGNMQPPKKIMDVPPEYPKAAQDARVQGVVILEAKIDEGGNVSDVRLLRSIPMLDAAAIEAVKQWKYTPVLLNGVPTSVVMTMTVNFTLRDAFDIRVILPDGKSMLTMFGGGMMHVVLPEGDFRLRAMRDRTSTAGAVISVFDEDGKTLLGDVYAEAGGPIVPMPTVPGVGLQLVSIR